MQPLANKRTKIQTGVARARLLLKHDLAWLPGYPMSMSNIEGESENTLSWHSGLATPAHRSQIWSIDGEHLRRAQMTISKLRHHFPRALPQITDDVDDWLRRIDFLFGLLKGFIHHGQPFTSDDVLRSGVLPARWTLEASRMKSAHPRLAGLLDAVIFFATTDRQTCKLNLLTWIERHASELVLLSGVDPEDPFELPCRMLNVRETLSSKLLHVLVRCLTDPLICDCRWKQPDARLRELCEQTLRAAKQNEFLFPQVSSGESLSHLVRTVFDEACLAGPKLRRDRFQLLDKILTQELIEGIAKTQLQIAAGESQTGKLLRRFEARHRTHSQKATSYQELKEIVAAAADIAHVQISTIIALGNCLTVQKMFGQSETRVWIDFLTGIPSEYSGLMVRLLSNWWRNWNHATDRQENFVRVIGVLSKLVQRRGIAPLMLKHWNHYVDEKRAYSEFVVDTSDELTDNPNLEIRTLQLLERVAYDLQLDIGSELISSLVEFAQATDDDNLSCLLIKHLSEKPDAAYDAGNLRLAYHFGDSIDSISGILTALQSDHELTKIATQLKPLANDQDLKLIVAERLAENDVSILSRIAATSQILNNIERPLPKRARFEPPGEWMNRYPGDFHSVLESLGQATPDAPKIAESILGKAFPSAGNLSQQIKALESKLLRGTAEPTDEIRMQGRLANLRRRRTQTALLSPARRDKLIAKLSKRTALEILQQYATTSRLQAAAAMRQRFRLKAFPDEWLQPPLDRVLREINGLNSSMQELGIRLIFETLERTTRNFDQEPRNVVFRERMEASGVRLEPWLNDQLRQSGTTADGCPYELAFTRDVIDFLLMGFHFNTCLSPDSFNFFSTVANAVDVNKRVLYAKTADGRVIGRCLFTLNDSGEILTYYRYSHDPKDGFAGVVEQFAQQLASLMCTSIATVGRVSKLVAKDWYDDGPWQTDLNWLGDNGTLAKLTKELTCDRLLPALLEAKGRKFLKRRVSELAIDSRVRDKTEFLEPLLDEFEDEMTVRQKFTIAVNVESTAASHRLLSQLRWSEIVGVVNRHRCNECDVFHGIADYSRVFRVLGAFHPTLALRAIRASRPSSIKSDVNDLNRTRRNALAQVHRALGREHLARKLTVT